MLVLVMHVVQDEKRSSQKIFQNKVPLGPGLDIATLHALYVD